MIKERELLEELSTKDMVSYYYPDLINRIKDLLAEPEPEPVELENIIKQIHNNAFYEGNSHVIGVRDVLTIFRNYLKSKKRCAKTRAVK